MTAYQLIELIEKMNIYAAAFVVALMVVVVNVIIGFVRAAFNALIGAIVGLAAVRIRKHDEIAIGDLKKWHGISRNEGFPANPLCPTCGKEPCSFANPFIVDCLEWEPDK